MKDSKILNRIRKLLAMADASESPQEAQIAAAKAHAMLREYNLSLGDIALSESEVKELAYETGLGALPYWVVTLAQVIGNAFNCTTCTQASYEYDKKELKYRTLRNLVFIGIDADVEVANYVYGYMFRYVKSAMGNVKGRNAKREFATGFALGLEDRLKEEFPPPSDLKAKEGALVIAKEAKINSYLEDEYGGLKTERTKRKTPKNSNAMQKGRKEALECPLKQALRPQQDDQLALGLQTA